MRLIVNADDFGLSRGQNYGIIDCFSKGIVTAATLLTTTPEFDHACQLAFQYTDLDIGVHLSLDLGSPLSPLEEIPSLIADGKFRRYLLEENDIEVNPEEVYREWKKQIEKALQAGLTPSHIDSHHHIHMMTSVFPVFIRLAREYDLAIRFHPRKWSEDAIQQTLPEIGDVRKADQFVNQFYGKSITPDFFETLTCEENLTLEMMCHPAYLDQWIMQNSSYNFQRSVECETLQAEETKGILGDRGIELISFKELAKVKVSR